MKNSKENIRKSSKIHHDIDVLDGVVGEKTWNHILNIDTVVTDRSNVSTQMFECPHCGGTSTIIKSGKTLCAYCNSEIIHIGGTHAIR